MYFTVCLCIINMKIFLAQIYCLFLFSFDSKNRKKCFNIVCISILMLYISVRSMSSNFYFCNVFFLTKKRVPKGVYRSDSLFLLLDHIKVRQTARFYTTQGLSKNVEWVVKIKYRRQYI